MLELDVTDPGQVEAVRDELGRRWDRVDGALHAIGFAPPSCLGGGFVDAPWEDVAVALQISAYSLKTLADVVVPHMSGGGSIVGLDFDNSTQAWPAYDWMGVAKAALESTSRYLARDLGPAGHPREPGGGRPDQDAGGQVDPRLPALRGRVGRAQPARLGREGRRRRPSPGPAWRCCRTGSPRPPARSSTSTAASTPRRSSRSRALQRSEPAGVGDEELVVDAGRHQRPDLLQPVVELTGSDPRRQLGVARAVRASAAAPACACESAGSSATSRSRILSALVATRAWNDSRPSVPLRTSPSTHSRTASSSSAIVGRSCTVAPAARSAGARRSRGGPGSRPSTSHSFSHTRRPIVACSIERDAPLRWLHACMMHITPHLSVPSVSHQRRTSRSTGAPPAAS